MNLPPITSPQREGITWVTFPRSGHHLLVNLLLKYFSGNLNHFNTDGAATREQCTDVIRAGALSYCEYYHHCVRVPCSQPGTTLQKHHDRKLSLPREAEHPYLIQIRHPLPALISYQRFLIARAQRDGRRVRPRRTWKQMQAVHLPYWKTFVAKWVREPPAGSLTVRYEALLARPSEVLREVLAFLDPGRSVDEQRIGAVIAAQGIRPPNPVSSFELYRRRRFARLQAEVAPLLAAAGIDEIPL